MKILDHADDGALPIGPPQGEPFPNRVFHPHDINGRLVYDITVLSIQGKLVGEITAFDNLRLGTSFEPREMNRLFDPFTGLCTIAL